MNEHDDPSTLTGAYAVDALTEQERAALERALEQSPALRDETASLHETALALAYAVEPVEPPTAMKASLMATIATTPQRDAVRSASAPAVDAPAPAAEPVAPVIGLEARPTTGAHRATTAGPAERSAQRRWFTRPAARIAAAAAAVVIVGGIGFGVNDVFSTSGPGTNQAQTPSQLDEIYAASDMQRTTDDVTGGGTATVVWSNEVGKSAVIFDGVKAAPPGKTYELWYISSDADGGKISSAGLVDGVDGGVRAAILSGSKRAGDTIGVTIEPSGGSKQPTTKPILAVSTSKA